ncbi:hypothetical protein [Fluviicola taffensis]|uniref:Uncharacterized protein n=1 Tax=Fluviicola taffensis (strain DSM 16823 / NCIMB 13979 / RW262) TaxID=755732 RepID=F2IC51_FLUTR|nr:hypothetical protein [Fluviicola taffensis]AEA43277.1 hypothetical protein Fluta_1282 [Fluviicola taffensis DSM 16823]
MFERKLYIAILLGFFILSGIGMCFGNPEEIPWSDWISEKGRWVLILGNLLFLFLAIRQLRIWNISVGENEIYLKRFLGSKKITLLEKELTSFHVELHKDPWWMKGPRTTILITLHTTQGTITLNSSDYSHFDSTLAKLFSKNRQMHMECLRKISTLKSKKNPRN